MNKLVAVLLKTLLISLDLLVTLVTFGWIGAVKKALTKQGMRSVPLGSDVSHRVHTDVVDGKLIGSPSPDVKTLYDLLTKSAGTYSFRNALGSREYKGQKTPKVKEFGPDIKWVTFNQLNTKMLKFGAALRDVGLQPAPTTCNTDKFDTPRSLAIFENTCSEWIIAALGAFSQSIVVTTIYATLGMDAVIDAINNGVISALLCNQANVQHVIDISAQIPTLKTIIYTSDLIPSNSPSLSLKNVPANITVISFDNFINKGAQVAIPTAPPSPGTCAVVMYTSGSTGKPKGVVITHQNLLASVTGALTLLKPQDGDVYLGYLPLAHILELMAELGMLSCGIPVCFADPKTLTSTGSYPIGALEAFSPSLMAGVPKIWDVIKKGAQAKIAAGSPVTRLIAETAFEARAFALNHGYDTPLFNALVFKKFSALVGGNLRYALSGGGPLHTEIQTFIRTAFGIPLVQGYGLTETAAGLSIQAADDTRSGIAGVPLPCCEVKLLSCPDISDKASLPYMSTDTKDNEGNPIYGRGEILIKGLNVGLGYYMMPDKTKEDFDSDGFFHTGDIGQFMSDGSIRIVDRKKNLVKLKGGEYIAIESMEGVYGNSAFVDPVAGGLVCYGDGDMDRPIAVIQVNHAYAKAWAKENDNPDKDNLDNVIKSKGFYDAVLANFKNEARNGGLSHLERVAAIAFTEHGHWTPENQCLTAANKLNRKVILEVEKDVFEEARKKAIF